MYQEQEQNSRSKNSVIMSNEEHHKIETLTGDRMESSNNE
jgi:hypothetical protein